MNALVIGTMHAPGLPLPARYTILLPCMAVVNAATCRVFRDLKLGVSSHFGPGSAGGSCDVSELVFAATVDDGGRDV